MNRRFFIESPITHDSIRIDGPDAHHIVNVNRMSVDDDIMLFDGSGREFVAKIIEIRKKSVDVDILQILEISREITGSLALAVAMPKGDRQKMLVEKLVELGVTQLIPMNCERSVAIASDKSTERLRRRVIEASKQCGRNVLMQIASPVSFDELVRGEEIGSQPFFAHPYDSSICANQAVNNIAPTDAVVIAIGPEGGFADAETELAVQHDWQSLSLGRSILRVETAAAAAATLFGIGRQSASNSR